MKRVKRTYTAKTKLNTTEKHSIFGSESRYNCNGKNRYTKLIKRLHFKELSVNSATCLTDGSIEISLEDTFDKLLTGKVFHKVNRKTCFTKVTSSESDESKSKVHNETNTINSFVYSPVMQKKFGNVKSTKLNIGKLSTKFSVLNINEESISPKSSKRKKKKLKRKSEKLNSEQKSEKLGDKINESTEFKINKERVKKNVAPSSDLKQKLVKKPSDNSIIDKQSIGDIYKIPNKIQLKINSSDVQEITSKFQNSISNWTFRTKSNSNCSYQSLSYINLTKANNKKKINNMSANGINCMNNPYITETEKENIHATTINKSEEKSYESLFSDTFKEKQTIVSSTPFIEDVTKIIHDKISPIDREKSSLKEINCNLDETPKRYHQNQKNNKLFVSSIEDQNRIIQENKMKSIDVINTFCNLKTLSGNSQIVENSEESLEILHKFEPRVRKSKKKSSNNCYKLENTIDDEFSKTSTKQFVNKNKTGVDDNYRNYNNSFKITKRKNLSDPTKQNQRKSDKITLKTKRRISINMDKCNSLRKSGINFEGFKDRSAENSKHNDSNSVRSTCESKIKRRGHNLKLIHQLNSLLVEEVNGDNLITELTTNSPEIPELEEIKFACNKNITKNLEEDSLICSDIKNGNSKTTDAINVNLSNINNVIITSFDVNTKSRTGECSISIQRNNEDSVKPAANSTISLDIIEESLENIILPKNVCRSRKNWRRLAITPKKDDNYKSNNSKQLTPNKSKVDSLLQDSRDSAKNVSDVKCLKEDSCSVKIRLQPNSNDNLDEINSTFEKLDIKSINLPITSELDSDDSQQNDDVFDSSNNSPICDFNVNFLQQYQQQLQEIKYLNLDKITCDTSDNNSYNLSRTTFFRDHNYFTTNIERNENDDSSNFVRNSDAKELEITKPIIEKGTENNSIEEIHDEVDDTLDSFCGSFRYRRTDRLALKTYRRSLWQSRRTSILTKGASRGGKEEVLARCGQTKPQPFTEIYPISILKNCKKIGEGVYGEVFLLKVTGDSSKVMKIIPIEGNELVNGEKQKKFEEIYSEIVIAMELSNLKSNNINQTCGFNRVYRISCLQGSYPAPLIELWNKYDDEKGSENDSPDMFSNDQLYIVLELAHGGLDLEAYVFSSTAQIFSVFKQVAVALAIAEEQLKFEHRDLHWGNILINNTKKKKFSYIFNGKTHNFMSCGVEVAVIDYTLSRAEYEGMVIFNDLSKDNELFEGDGDYQFEIYRLMKQTTGNLWESFTPYTNILWLHYILDKCVNGARYKPKNKSRQYYLTKLKCLKEKILDFQSATDFLQATSFLRKFENI